MEMLSGRSAGMAKSSETEDRRQQRFGGGPIFRPPRKPVFTKKQRHQSYSSLLYALTLECMPPVVLSALPLLFCPMMVDDAFFTFNSCGFV